MARLLAWGWGGVSTETRLYSRASWHFHDIKFLARPAPEDDGEDPPSEHVIKRQVLDQLIIH